MLILTKFFSDFAAGKFPNLTLFKEALQGHRQELDASNTSFERFIGKDLDTPIFDAPKRLAFPSYISSDAALRQHDRADYQQTDPRIAFFAAKLIELLRRQNIPFYVHAAFRTKEEQQDAYKRGVSKLVWPRAAHCQGKAVDIVHGTFHWQLTKQEWAFIGKVGKDLHFRMMQQVPKDQRWELQWGGDWSSPYDPAHWEIKHWQSHVIETTTAIPVRRTPRYILRHCAPSYVSAKSQ
ncbi:MAG: hypothetical protein [Microviridae sp.]|nr:MAG: hypothetical protein [Microviridae sp.]